MISRIVRPFMRFYSVHIHRHVPRFVARKILHPAYQLFIGRAMQNDAIDDTYRVYSSLPLIRKGDTVFDIGANRGGFADVFLRLGAAKVVCLEPDPSCVKMLREKFKADPRVEIVAAGVGEKEGEMDLFISEVDGVSTFSEEFKSLEEKEYSGKYVGKHLVAITSLDALISKHGRPSYIKIDVEGFELQVLSGLSKKINFVSFEFRRQMLPEAKECTKKLMALGRCSFTYTHYDPTKPAFPHGWMGCEELFETIKNEPKSLMDATGDINFYRTGDIFARIE